MKRPPPLCLLALLTFGGGALGQQPPPVREPDGQLAQVEPEDPPADERGAPEELEGLRAQVQALRDMLQEQQAGALEREREFQERTLALERWAEQAPEQILDSAAEERAEGRQVRGAELELALREVERANEEVVAGADRLSDRIRVAQEAVGAAAEEAERNGTPQEARHLVEAVRLLQEVPALLEERNHHLAQVALFGAGHQLAQALALARSPSAAAP